MAAHPSITDVAVHGFTWAAAGSWTLAIVVTTVITRLLRSVGGFSGIAALYTLIVSRNRDLRAEKRAEDVADAARADIAERRANAAEAKVVYLSSAVSLLLGAVESLANGDPAIMRIASQARDLVAMATDTDDDFGRSLKRLATAPGVRE